MIEIHITYFDKEPHIKKYIFKNMERVHHYLVSNECRKYNEHEFFKMNASIKILIYDNNKLKEQIFYKNYCDFCMHKKSKHQVLV